MSVVIFFTLVFAVLIALLIITQIHIGLPLPKQPPIKGDTLEIWPFVPSPLMTNTEVIFFNQLTQALPEYHIFSQVQLSRLIEPSIHADTQQQFWLNHICQYSVDFVVVDTDLQTVLVVIELDDWIYLDNTRKQQNLKKDKALSSAGIPVIRFYAETMPSTQMIRRDILTLIQQFDDSRNLCE